MRYTAFSKSWAQASEFVPSHVLRGGYIFDRRIRGFCTGYMAFAVIHGADDLYSFDRLTDPGNR